MRHNTADNSRHHKIATVFSAPIVLAPYMPTWGAGNSAQIWVYKDPPVPPFSSSSSLLFSPSSLLFSPSSPSFSKLSSAPVYRLSLSVYLVYSSRMVYTEPILSLPLLPSLLPPHRRLLPISLAKHHRRGARLSCRDTIVIIATHFDRGCYIHLSARENMHSSARSMHCSTYAVEG